MAIEFEEATIQDDGPHTSIVQKFPLFSTNGKVYATGSRKQPLYRQGERVRYVHFPNGGVCVMTAPTSNAMMVQVTPVGDEGMVGIEAFFTDEPVASGEIFVQVANADTDAEQLGGRTSGAY